MAAIDTQYLVAVLNEAQQAGHGQRGEVYDRACQFLGISLQTLHRQLSGIRPNSRKRRSDSGACGLPREEALIISSTLMEGYSKHDKKRTSLDTAVEFLRSNGLIVAATLDADTGELVPLSTSAISRALKSYNLHPDQLRRPAPHMRLGSDHPNQVWQVDGSVCTLYYLPSGQPLIETDQAVHYKNKPHNLAAIEKQRVIRYVGTDHTSGVIRWRYYPHAESGEHTVMFLAWMMLPKADLTQDPFHGVPFRLQVDPGATSAGLVQRFCDRLGVELLVSKPGSPRSKGQVENAQNIVETQFEQGLRFCSHKIRSIDDLNQLADVYQRHFNATRVHSRHGMARTTAWLHIRPEQLRIVNAGVDLMALAHSKPERRKVNGDLTINYKQGDTRAWKVGKLPGIANGDWLEVCDNPLTGMVMAVLYGEDGRETYVELEPVVLNEFGLSVDAPGIGNRYASHADTQLDENRKAVAALATGATNLDDAKKARNKKAYVPFDGKIDPFKTAKETELQTVLPRAGTALGDVVEMEFKRLNHAAMMIWMASMLGDEWEPATMNPELRKRFPDGATTEELEQVLADLRAGRSAAGKARLQAV